MLGNFSYHNPTKLYFGENSLNFLDDELKKYGDNILLVYGSGSIKKNGIYDEVISILKKNKKNVIEVSNVMPNPTIDKVYEGLDIAKGKDISLILAVGGGSVIDYAKALSVSINFKGDPWDEYFIKFKEPTCKIVPVGSILTMVGTGSEMNAGSVITNPKTNEKNGHVFGSEVMPKFSILNPTYTMSLSIRQMNAGIYDIFNHICEQYFSNTDDNVSDDLAIAMLKSVVKNSIVANKDPKNYEARSNIMWLATWALNTLIDCGKSTDWMVHMIGQAIGGVTNAIHGETLASVSLAYYNYILPYGVDKFKRFAIDVFNVNPKGNDIDIAKEGLKEMAKGMDLLHLPLNTSILGVNKDNIDLITKNTFILDGGYKVLTKEEIKEILIESL